MFDSNSIQHDVAREMRERGQLILAEYSVPDDFAILNDWSLILLHLLPSEVEGQTAENLLQVVFSVKFDESEVIDEDEIVRSSIRSIILFESFMIKDFFSFITVAGGGKTGRRCKTNIKTLLPSFEIDKIVCACEDLLRASYEASSNVV